MAKLSEIASWLGTEAPVGEREIVRVSALENASADALVFVTDGKLLERALESNAGAILAEASLRNASAVDDDRILWVNDVRLAFAVAAMKLRRTAGEGKIDPRASVGAGVEVGEGTSIGPGTVIGDGVRIGRDCAILANATICAGASLGNRVVVQSGAVLGATGFGYVRDRETGKYIGFPQQGTLEIEDDVEIGANTTIDKGALGATRIGCGTKIDNLVHIAHNCVIGKNVVIAAQTGISGSTVVGDGAVIGGQVGIGDHASIGEGVILGSGSGVLSKKRLQGAGQVFWGIPAQPLKAYLRSLARMRRS